MLTNTPVVTRTIRQNTPFIRTTFMFDPFSSMKNAHKTKNGDKFELNEIQTHESLSVCAKWLLCIAYTSTN